MSEAADDDAPRVATGAATEDTLAATAMTGHHRSGDSLDDEPTLAEGTAVGRYIILGRIGAGGMGVVYVAFDPQLDRRVAVKLLRHKTKTGTSARARLLREAQALARLSHPSVVAIHDVGEHEGRVFLAMELVEGQTLRKWLRASTRRVREILDVLARAGRGLAAAHAKGIIHRDFKPDNVMVDDDGRVRVMDFGLARADDSASASASGSIRELRAPEPADPLLTRDGATMGTPAYMAPEQHLGRETDARTDQFSFCVAAYEALFGVRPFSGDSIAALSWSVTEGKLGPTPKGRRVPSAVLRALVRGLASDPAERWPTMDELLRALEHDPGPTRKRWLAAGVVAGVVGTGLGYQRWQQARLVKTCEREGQAIATVWHDQRKSQVGTALHATGISYADDSWRRASAELDTYAQQWSELRTEVCRRTRIDSTWPMPMLGRANECFEERRARLSSLLDGFENPEAAMVPRVVSAVMYLAPVTECADASWLARRPADPDDPELRERSTDFRKRLAEVGALSSTGRYGEADTLATAMVQEATTLQAPQLIAEARVALGLVLEREGEFARAREELERAFFVAGGAGHDAAALKAATRLVFVIGYQLADHDAGLHWAELAQMLITRLGLDNDAAVSRLQSNVGSVHQARGKYDDALAAQTQALEVARQAFGDEHPRVAVMWTNLANAHHGQGEYAEAVAAHEKALAIYEATLGEFHPDLAMTLLNLGVAFHSLDDDDRAIASFERALEIQTAAFGESHPQVARTLNNLGAMHFGRDDDTKALAAYERALQIQRTTLGETHHDLAGSYNNIGRVQMRRDDPEAALASYAKALEIRTASLRPTHPHIARVYLSIGHAHRARGALPEAIAAYEQALKIGEANDPKHPKVASALVNLGETLVETGEVTRAGEVLRRALAIRADTGAREKDLGRARFGLARALVGQKGLRGEAVEHARKAQQELTTAGAPTDEIDAWLTQWDSGRPLP